MMQQSCLFNFLQIMETGINPRRRLASNGIKKMYSHKYLIFPLSPNSSAGINRSKIKFLSINSVKFGGRSYVIYVKFRIKLSTFTKIFIFGTITIYILKKYLILYLLIFFIYLNVLKNT